MVAADSHARLTGTLSALGIATSTWYRETIQAGERRRPGPARREIPPPIRDAVLEMAKSNPWHGYQRIAVMCRKADDAVSVTDRQAYRAMREAGLLQKRRTRNIEAYQASKLFELLPQKPNDLWQMDVTYVYIAGYGWRYVISVIDYYSRYLLACHLTWSYSAAQAEGALHLARTEAERVHGSLTKPPFLVTDNGSSFIARRFTRFVSGSYSHVRIAYRTPTQLGLLERFHRTLKEEEIYWRLYDNPRHARECLSEFHTRYNTRRPHWALVPAEGGDPFTPAEVYASGHEIEIPRWQSWARAAQEKLEAMNQEPAA